MLTILISKTSETFSSKSGKMPSKTCIIILSDSESLEDGLETKCFTKNKTTNLYNCVLKVLASVLIKRIKRYKHSEENKYFF